MSITPTKKQKEHIQQLRDLHLSTICNLAFSGGSVKGLTYPGAIRGLVDTGVMDGVTAVAGSSIGSVVATLLAVGSNPHQIEAIFNSDMRALLGERVGSILSSNAPGTRFFSKSTEKGCDLMRKAVRMAIRSYFAGIDDKERLQDPKLKLIKDKLDHVPPQAITFADLDTLHNIDPCRFKKLSMTATTYPNCELLILSADTTPDVEIALAVSASCCIPGMFSPIELQCSPSGDKIKVVDGGVVHNLPFNCFDKNDSNEFVNNNKHQTLLFAFAGGCLPNRSAAFSAMHTTQSFVVTWIKWFLFDVLMPLIANLVPKFSLARREEVAYNAIQNDFALRTVLLHTSSIGPLSFDKAKQSSRILYALGYLDTVNYIVNHQLHDQWTINQFRAKDVYSDIVCNFWHIYSAVLLGTGKKPSEDTLMVQLKSVLTRLTKSVCNCSSAPIHPRSPDCPPLDPADKSRDIGTKRVVTSLTLPEVILLMKTNVIEAIHLIKANVIEAIDSPAAFALSRALELHLNKITLETLFKETYIESFKHSGYCSVSKVSGERCVRLESLCQALQGKDMFTLYAQQQKDRRHHTRTEDVFELLRGIHAFNDEAHERYGRPSFS